uniref:Putative secreted protein n=1 Tax=Ixodes scapularis TaxID=6945 RepID=A0A4D5RBC3_IXOSC
MLCLGGFLLIGGCVFMAFGYYSNYRDEESGYSQAHARDYDSSQNPKDVKSRFCGGDPSVPPVLVVFSPSFPAASDVRRCWEAGGDRSKTSTAFLSCSEGPYTPTRDGDVTLLWWRCCRWGACVDPFFSRKSGFCAHAVPLTWCGQARTFL